MLNIWEMYILGESHKISFSKCKPIKVRLRQILDKFLFSGYILELTTVLSKKPNLFSSQIKASCCSLPYKSSKVALALQFILIVSLQIVTVAGCRLSKFQFDRRISWIQTGLVLLFYMHMYVMPLMYKHQRWVTRYL